MIQSAQTRFGSWDDVGCGESYISRRFLIALGIGVLDFLVVIILPHARKSRCHRNVDCVLANSEFNAFELTDAFPKIPCTDS